MAPPSPVRLTLHPRNRLRSKLDFERLQKQGRKLYSKHFLIVVAPAQEHTPQSRFAVAVTKKIDSRAVVRNRLRRRLRELFRVYRHHLNNPLDILVIARKDSSTCSFKEVRREILGALTHAGLLVRVEEP